MDNNRKTGIEKSEVLVEPKQSKEREVYWIVGIMAGILLILFLAPVISRSLNSFAYHDLAFAKESDGKNIFYHYYYYFDDSSGQKYKYNLFLRKNPRENNVSVFGEIVYPAGKKVYYSINGSELAGCNNSLRDVSSISAFLTNNLFTVMSGTPDKEEAEANNLTHITCERYANNTVILLQAASETFIEQRGYCSIINVAHCQILDAVEKFEVQSILDAKKRQNVKS